MRTTAVYLDFLLALDVRTRVTDYPPADVDMKLEKVSEHVYFVQGAAGVATDNEGFISNAGVIVTDAGVVVFDAWERRRWPTCCSEKFVKSPTSRWSGSLSVTITPTISTACRYSKSRVRRSGRRPVRKSIWARPNASERLEERRVITRPLG